MFKPKFQSLSFSYQKPGLLSVLNINTIPLPPNFEAKESSLVVFEPEGIGGNHAHPRTEVFVCVQGELTLFWQDSSGERHHQDMAPSPKGVLQVFTLPPHLPHAVMNRSKTTQATLLEFADSPQHRLVPVKLI